MSPVTMIPVGAIGDSEPELQPLPTMIAIRNGEIFIRSAVAIAIGASRPVVAMLPGPAPALAQAHGVVRDDVERPVHARLAEQQRDAREREEQVHGETRRDLAQR